MSTLHLLSLLVCVAVLSVSVDAGTRIYGVESCTTKCDDVGTKSICKFVEFIDAVNITLECECSLGWTGDGLVCNNVDECAEPQLNNCDDIGGECIDEPGTFRCECLPGYRDVSPSGLIGTMCDQINECREQTDVCDEKISECIDTPGSYNCSCNSGYRNPVVNGTTDHQACENINECLSPSLHHCPANSTCIDQPGAFKCECDEGYKWTNNNTICDLLDECKEIAFNPCDTERSVCVNENPGYRCECRSGYEQANINGKVDNKHCTNVDECAENKHDCNKYAECIDTKGSFNCSCIYGFEGNGTHCEEKLPKLVDFNKNQLAYRHSQQDLLINNEYIRAVSLYSQIDRVLKLCALKDVGLSPPTTPLARRRRDLTAQTLEALREKEATLQDLQHENLELEIFLRQQKKKCGISDD